jgi:hypothetical protein
MHQFKSIIYKYSSNAEKTGWTFVEIPQDIIGKLKLKDRKGFRIKGLMDDVKFEKLSTYPVKGGGFIIAINADMRKKLGKNEGAMVIVKFEVDTSKPLQSKELIDCLKEDESALIQFKLQPVSHQNYFHRYIESAKGQATKAGRIVNVIDAMHKKMNFGEMIRSLKKPS